MRINQIQNLKIGQQLEVNLSGNKWVKGIVTQVIDSMVTVGGTSNFEPSIVNGEIEISRSAKVNLKGGGWLSLDTRNPDAYEVKL